MKSLHPCDPAVPRRFVVRLLLPLVTSGMFPPSSNADIIPLDRAHWAQDGGKLDFVTHDGRPCLRLESGAAWARDIDFSEGILEAEISATNKPKTGPLPIAFTGLMFHAGSDGNADDVYLRQQRSRQPDSLQYAPDLRRDDSWQHYPELQALCIYPDQGWIHLKILTQRGAARIFVGDMSQPVLIVPQLQSGRTSGRIGVWSLSPQPIYFSQLQVTPLPKFVNGGDTRPTPVMPVAGMNYRYEMSQVFAADRTATVLEYPDSAVLRRLKWDDVATDPDGLLSIGRYRQKKRSGNFLTNSDDLVWIRLPITSDRRAVRRLLFDFTNRAWVFLNKQPLYFGDHGLRARGPTYLGEIDKRLVSDAVYLSLEPGANELMVAVSSVANGWAFISRLEPASE